MGVDALLNYLGHRGFLSVEDIACAKQKRHQRTNARSYAQEVGESLRRVFGCHFVSAFRKKKPAKENNRFIFFIQIYRNLFHPVSQLKSRQPTNVYQEKNVIF